LPAGLYTNSWFAAVLDAVTTIVCSPLHAEPS